MQRVSELIYREKTTGLSSEGKLSLITICG